MVANKLKKDRLTSERQIILDYLRSVKTHPSAEMIYKEVKKKLPRISLGTVYRNLKSLKEKGEIQELIFGPIPSRFDGNPERHIHFQCKSCGQILDIAAKITKKCSLCLKKILPGQVTDYRVEIYGLCSKCQNKLSRKKKRLKKITAT